MNTIEKIEKGLPRSSKKIQLWSGPLTKQGPNSTSAKRGVKASSEDDVTYCIMQFLKKHRWEILQYHPPGGQANFAIKTKIGVVFPDIVAIKEGVILIVENKRSQSKEDIKKLAMMLQDKSVHQQIVSHCITCCRTNGIPAESSYTIKWAHGFGGTMTLPQHDKINYLLAGVCSNVTVIPSVKDPLTV